MNVFVTCPVCKKSIALSVAERDGGWMNAGTPDEAEARVLLAAALREHLKIHARPAEPTS